MKRWKVQSATVAVAFTLMAMLGAPCAFAEGDERALVYHGGEEESYTVKGSALFEPVESNLPGDALTGALFIENDSDVACEVFTSAEKVVADGPDDMLGRIVYVVNDEDGETVYEGFLEDARDAEPISLGVLGPGETMTTEYGVSIPAELTNEYADASVGMNLGVTMVERKAGDDGGGDGGDDAAVGLVRTGASAAAPGGADLAQTGDMLVGLPFILGAAAAAGTVIWCAWKRRMRMW